MTITTLWPEGWVHEEPAKADKSTLRETAKGLIRAAVLQKKDEGKPLLVDELVKPVRTEKSGCHALWPEEVIECVAEVAAERSPESQGAAKAVADAGLVEEPIESKEG